MRIIRVLTAVSLVGAGVEVVSSAAAPRSVDSPRRGGYATLQPGTLVSLPFLGQLSWQCVDGRRSASFSHRGPSSTEVVTLTGDGKPLSKAVLGVRTRRLAAPMGHWRVLSFHVSRYGEPGSVGTTLTVHFRLLSPPTRQCFVPQFSVTQRTRSHETTS